MYQLEVKHEIVRHQFPPSDGWEVLVDVDAMERAKGFQQKPDKKEKVIVAENKLIALGARIGIHEVYGRVDVFARHKDKGTFLVEVEGQSSKQKEQAMYSAIGQTILMMGSNSAEVFYAIAVPDDPAWERQIQKIPSGVKSLLRLYCYLVSEGGVREI